MSVKEQIKNGVTGSGEIRTITDMWNAAVEHHTIGNYDTDAISDIKRRMNPKLTFQDIANVCAGVFADTYWNNCFLDFNFLSKSLIQSIGIDKSSADSYAQNAMQQWRGILCRKNIADIGTIPTRDGYTQSIDIVCNQNTPLNADDLIENWNNQFWGTPQVGKNYTYVRCANTQFLGSIDNLNVEMFYSTGGFNQPPTSWIQCLTAANGSPQGKVLLLGGKPGPMSSGDRGVSEAFMFNPASPDHVCVIASITSNFFKKNNPKSISSNNWDSNTYITHNGASAWHNFDPQKSIESSLVFFNQDGSHEDFSFSVNCRNVPVGSIIGIKCIDPKCSFDSGLIEITRSSQQIEQHFTMPPHFKGNLIVTMKDRDGNMLPNNAAVQIDLSWNLNKGHKCYRRATSLHNAVDIAVNSETISLNMGSFTLTGGK